MKLYKLTGVNEAEFTPIDAAKVLSGAPATRLWVHYQEAGGKRAAGQWEATIGKWRIAYTEWEYVLMISGHCLVAGDDGTIIEAAPGDAFVIEPGFTGTWEVTETMRKHWVIEER